jgi:butyrate kinase
MREVLLSGRDGIHPCNLSAVIADDIATEVTAFRRERGIGGPACMAYVADPPMADEMLPECHIGGLPDFPRRAFFHALNSRAVVRRYLREHGHTTNDVTAIVAHMGGGITVTLHRNGKVIDTNNALGGDGPFTPERAGSCPAFPLIEMCFRSGLSEREVKHRVLGRGGAVAFFGTNDLRELERRAADDPKVDTWLDAFGTGTKTNTNGEKVASPIAAVNSERTTADGLSDAERIRVLERENVKLREEREILRKAAKISRAALRHRRVHEMVV